MAHRSGEGIEEALQHIRAKSAVVAHGVAQPPRQGAHPLADRNFGKDLVHQVGGDIIHPAGTLGYGGRWIGSDVWTHGPRLAFEAGIAFDGWIVAGYAGGRYTVPVSIAGQPVGATVQGGAAEIGARIRHRLGLWELGLGVGPFVEWLSAEGSTASDSGLQATTAPLQTLVAIATEGLIGLRIAGHLPIEHRVGVETEIKGATVAYRESGADREVFSPAIVRPRASAGLRLDW